MRRICRQWAGEKVHALDIGERSDWNATTETRMQYLAQVSQPRGRHFYQKYHISNPGGTILTKNVLFPTQGAGF